MPVIHFGTLAAATDSLAPQLWFGGHNSLPSKLDLTYWFDPATGLWNDSLFESRVGSGRAGSSGDAE